MTVILQPLQELTQTGQAGVLRLSDLGWSNPEALDTRIRLRSFKEDFEAAGPGCLRRTLSL